MSDDLSHLSPDPLQEFYAWFEQAKLSGDKFYDAMTLSTVDERSRPDGRILLYKGHIEGKLVFYTNYDSPKAEQMKSNAHVALLFFWPSLHHQVRIRGQVELMDTTASRDYFYSRPRGSQISAVVSPQSQKVTDRAQLEQSWKKAEQSIGDGEVTFPDNWGGYLVSAYEYEFWKGQENRLHDRYLYELNGKHWDVSRLAP